MKWHALFYTIIMIIIIPSPFQGKWDLDIVWFLLYTIIIIGVVVVVNLGVYRSHFSRYLDETWWEDWPWPKLVTL